MENTVKNKSPFYAVDLGDIKLNVYVIGRGPCLHPHKLHAAAPENLSRVHTHFAYEAFFVTRGVLTLTNESYARSYERTVLLIPPGSKHCSLVAEEGSYCLLFSFAGQGRRAELVQQRIGEGVCQIPMTEEIAFYISCMAKAYGEPGENAKRRCNWLVSLLFNELLTFLLPEREESTPVDASVHIGQIETYINRNLHGKITLADVAKYVYLSTRQVARVVERAYGCSFSELITAKRLAAAELMLKNTDVRISEIAAAILPDSPGYFYVLFKKHYGLSPLQYRKESRIAQSR